MLQGEFVAKCQASLKKPSVVVTHTGGRWGVYLLGEWIPTSIGADGPICCIALCKPYKQSTVSGREDAERRCHQQQALYNNWLANTGFDPSYCAPVHLTVSERRALNVLVEWEGNDVLIAKLKKHCVFANVPDDQFGPFLTNLSGKLLDGLPHQLQPEIDACRITN